MEIACFNCFAPVIQTHFNQKLCADCRVKARRKAQEKYKNTQKGKLSNSKWVKSAKRKQNEKEYKSKPKARSLAVVRVKRHLAKCVNCQIKKRIRDKAYSRSIIGRQYNNKASRKYKKTEKGRWQAKTYKYQLRHNLAGKIDKKAWEDKLRQLEGKCQICGTTENITIDHIIPLSKGGTNLIDNLQPLCRSCNCTKNNKL